MYSQGLPIENNVLSNLPAELVAARRSLKPMIPYFISTIMVLKIKKTKFLGILKRNEIASFEVLHIHMEMMEVILNIGRLEKGNGSFLN